MQREGPGGPGRGVRPADWQACAEAPAASLGTTSCPRGPTQLVLFPGLGDGAPSLTPSWSAGALSFPSSGRAQPVPGGGLPANL